MTTEAEKVRMREYMRKRRAAGLDKSRPPTDRPHGNAGRGRLTTDWSASAMPISGTKLGAALSAYHHSIGALERSAYLDALTLGKKPDEEAKPLAGGEQYLASPPVGFDR